MAFLSEVPGRGWCIIWHDATKGANRLGRRRISVVGGNHRDALDAAGIKGAERDALQAATNAKLRRKLLDAYNDLEVLRYRDAERTHESDTLPAFDTSARTFIGWYLELVGYREAIGRGERLQRPANDPGWRTRVYERTLSKSGAALARTILNWFRESLPATLTTGAMQAEHVRRFLLDTQSKRKWKPATANRARTILSGMFTALTTAARRRYFKADPTLWFRDDVEPAPEPAQEIVVYGASDVMAFLSEAEQRQDPNRTVHVKRRRGPNGKPQEYTQRPANHERPAPVLQWALLLACTGVRKGEAERLRWTDVDLATGLLRVASTKTSTVRHVPLIGDAAGDVAPHFLAVLRAWRERNPAAVFVLPAAVEGGTPCWPKHGWEATNTAAGTSVTPQGLRRTFESTLAAVGVPSGLAAFWLGHSVQVAERAYRAYAPGRFPGSTVEEALGIVAILEREARGAGTV